MSYHREEPDYGFTRGLDIQERTFEGGAAHRKESHIGRDKLLSLPNFGSDPERDALVVEQMRRRYTVHSGGAAITFSVVGPEDAGIVMPSLYGWGGNTQHPVAINEAQVMAANNPETQLIFVDTPQDRLPKAVEKQITQEGNYEGYGEIIAGAISGITGGKKVRVRGHSLGARQATGITPFIEQGVDSLIVNDPTGSRTMGLGSIVTNFIVREGGHLGKYVKAGFDAHASELQSGATGKVASDTANNIKGSPYQQFWVDPLGLSRGGFEHDLRDAAPNVKRLIRVISPELSALNNPDDIADILGRLSRIRTHGSAAIQQWVLGGHTHSFMSAAPTVEAHLYSER